MSDSLRDQLLGLGFKPAPKPERKAEDKRPPRSAGAAANARPGSDERQRSDRPHGDRHRGDQKRGDQGRSDPRRGNAPAARQGGSRQSEMDLAKAYAIRAQKEKEERIAAERARQEEARVRREARARIVALLQGNTLNDAAADIARHFEYGGKIRRIHVTADQLRALNAGELAVVQNAGRYHLVTAAIGRQAEELLSGARALQVDPDAPPGDDIYADPKYQVPDDLVW